MSFSVLEQYHYSHLSFFFRLRTVTTDETLAGIESRSQADRKPLKLQHPESMIQSGYHRK